MAPCVGILSKADFELDETHDLVFRAPEGVSRAGHISGEVDKRTAIKHAIFETCLLASGTWFSIALSMLLPIIQRSNTCITRALIILRIMCFLFVSGFGGHSRLLHDVCSPGILQLHSR